MIQISDFCLEEMVNRKLKSIIDEEIMDEFLTQEGFRCMYDSHKQTNMSRVRIQGKIVKYVSANELYQYLKEEIGREHKDWLKALKANKQLLYPHAMSQMKRVVPDSIRDTSSTSYLAFKNGIVAITKSDIKLLSFDDVLTGDSCILEDQIIPRNICLKGENYRNGEWYKFCQNAVGAKGLPYLMRALGYMSHNYKDNSNTKMIGLTDSISSQNSGVAMGGTGKSIIANNGLKHIRRLHWEDGKDFKPHDKFKFQGLKPSHDIICLDDIMSDLKIKTLYNKITGNFASEEKFRSKTVVSQNESPKIIVTANQMPPLEGDSDERRACLIAFSKHYNKSHTPRDEFGHQLFEDWTEQEWNYYFYFMFDCIKLFLGKGIESYYTERK